MEASEFWNKIKVLLQEKNKTQEWLCQQTGLVVQSMRNRIYMNRFPSLEETIKILSAFDMTVEEFYGIENKHKTSDVDNYHLRTIPVSDQVFSAGRGQYVPDYEEIKEYIAVPKELSDYPGELAACRVRGDSMEPTLYDDDIIICDNRCYDGNLVDGIYILLLNGQGFVKRLQRTANGVKLISDNKRYDPIFVGEGDVLNILGRVRFVIHKL